MHRSIHRSVRWVASVKRASSSDFDETTSSSAIMMSDPIWYENTMLVYVLVTTLTQA